MANQTDGTYYERAISRHIPSRRKVRYCVILAEVHIPAFLPDVPANPNPLRRDLSGDVLLSHQQRLVFHDGIVTSTSE